eukprot:2758195-Amphidinium_carterae.2
MCPTTEEWDVDLDAAKHMQAVDKGAAGHVATHPLRNTKFSRKLGRRRARRVGSRVSLSDSVQLAHRRGEEA